MATVRVYKIAELLGLTSQQAITLIKDDTGIEVKSASSSVEEIVARQFVERHAKRLQIALPSGPIFDAAVAKRSSRGRAPAEPPKARPKLRPRLVKKPKPPPEPEVVEEPAAERPTEVPESPEPTSGEPPTPVAEPPAAAEAPTLAAEPAVGDEPGAVEEPVAAAPAATEPTPSRPARVVPPTRRLRIEDPVTGQAPAARKVPTRPVVRPKQAPPAPTRPAPPPPPGGIRPASPRAPLGGPRPLPAQPVRPPGHMPGRPPGSRPSFRPGRRGPRTRRLVRPTPPPAPTPPPPITKLITLAEGMTVKDLADRLEVKAKDVLKKLIERRMMLTINSTLDAETAEVVSRDFGAEVVMRTFEEELSDVEAETSRPEDLTPRAPVVTVMGHVDHGKTTLLDAIRKAKVAEGEAGGITQHIGAYSVDVEGRRVVFLDTPGHEAFTLMRARGARVTDIVVLVVAADDGVMPQTKEAIDHAQAAKVPIIVAVNKIDKPEANPERVKRELAEHELTPEDWGGKTVTVEVSARQGQNLDQLLEMILLVADLADLKANASKMAQGTVLESKLDRGRGPVATVLVQDGSVKEGDLLIAGTVDGKVRALFDHVGRKITSAGPATPVEILGLSALPQPGDTFQVVDDPVKIRQVVSYRQAQAKERALHGRGGRLTLESLQEQMTEGGVKELPLIIKADVQGSAEVLAETLAKLTDERVKVRIIHTGVGAVNESDVLLASASNAVIIAFNVRPDRNAAEVAEREDIEIRTHSVIYNVTDEIKKAMTGLLDPTIKEVRLGSAEVRQTFKTPKVGTVAGCLVSDGKIARSGDAQARLLRDNVVVWEGRLASLRRFKDDVSEVKSGLECGIALERFNDIKVGDVIEAFTQEHVAQTV